MYKQNFFFLILQFLECSAIFNSFEASLKYGAISEELESTTKRDDVRNFVGTVLFKAMPTSSVCFITDLIYSKEIYHGQLTSSLDARLIYVLTIIDSESFESEPKDKVVTMLNIMRMNNCDYYIILITNGIQMLGLLRYADYNRLFNPKANFIMLHDYRLFTSESYYIWKRLINVIFIKKYESKRHFNWYEISTVPFPSSIREIYVSRILNYFIPPSRFIKKADFFVEKKNTELKRNVLNVVVYPHFPAVIKATKHSDDNGTNVIYTGLEIDLLHAIGEKMNFGVQFYETENNEYEKWGQRLGEGNYSGLLNEMNEARADIALADLYQTMYHFEVMDLSIPYTSHCLTFITPETLGDNSWQTLILPFSLGMWIGTILSLISIIIIFYFFSNFYKFLENKKTTFEKDIFDDFTACVIYSYSMILVVSLPQLPNRWSVRLLTGWWLLYCVLLVVAYRASLTSILANPQPKLTIDTLKMLAESKLKCGMWGEQNRNFFFSSSDPIVQKIGNKLDDVGEAEDGILKVEKGEFAYFESSIELKRLRFEHEKKLQKVSQTLHIMEECVINMPISIGLDKSSPLKEKFDELILYAIEGGLINKWYRNAIESFQSSVEESPAEALMDLKKFYGALMFLSIGYLLSIFVFIGEISYWNYFVKRHPNYDKYYRRIITNCELESQKIASRRKKANFLNRRQLVN